MTGLVRVIFIIFLILYLEGCGESKTKRIEQYIQQIKTADAANVLMTSKKNAMTETKVFHQATKKSARNPFFSENKKDSVEEKHFNSARRVLTKYSLDGLSFVGILEYKNQLWALIKTNDGRVSHASLGDFIGRNNDVIFELTEHKLVIKRLFQHLGREVQKKVTFWLK